MLKNSESKLNGQNQLLFIELSPTRSQKKRNNQQEVVENVSKGFVSPVIAENTCSSDQDVVVTAPSKPKFPRVENSVLESLRVSLKEEITSEIKSLLMESQREMLKLLRSETGENVRNSTIDETENERRSFHTPTKPVRINSTSNHDSYTYVSRNTNRAIRLKKYPCVFGLNRLKDRYFHLSCT